MEGKKPQNPVRDWKPPWPPIRISTSEWIIIRDSKTEPVGVIRLLKLGPRNETFYRVVTWALTSEGRTLVGYYGSLGEADRSIRFTPTNPEMPDIREASGHGMPPGPISRPPHEVAPGRANTPARTERD